MAGAVDVEKKRVWAKQYVAKKRAAGQCVQCMRPVEQTGHYHCNACKAARYRHFNAYRATRRAKYSRLEKARRARLRHYWYAIAGGICATCGGSLARVPPRRRYLDSHLYGDHPTVHDAVRVPLVHAKCHSSWDTRAYPLRRPDVPVPTLVRRYRAGESLELLARAFGCSPTTIRTRLRRAGVTLRGRVEAQRMRYARATPSR